MATITKFEDLEVWQLARQQDKDLQEIIFNTTLNKDYSLRNQISASSGSVMDNIAEGFERSGNNEFKISSLLRRALTVSSGLNYTGHWTGNIFLRKNLISFTKRIS
jgi:hypothetical protein